MESRNWSVHADSHQLNAHCCLSQRTNTQRTHFNTAPSTRSSHSHAHWLPLVSLTPFPTPYSSRLSAAMSSLRLSFLSAVLLAAAVILSLLSPTVAQCTAGSYSSQAGQFPCSPCAAGTYQPDDNQTQCLDCPSGEGSSAGSTDCTDEGYLVLDVNSMDDNSSDSSAVQAPILETLNIGEIAAYGVCCATNGACTSDAVNLQAALLSGPNPGLFKRSSYETVAAGSTTTAGIANIERLPGQFMLGVTFSSNTVGTVVSVKFSYTCGSVSYKNVTRQITFNGPSVSNWQVTWPSNAAGPAPALEQLRPYPNYRTGVGYRWAVDPWDVAHRLQFQWNMNVGSTIDPFTVGAMQLIRGQASPPRQFILQQGGPAIPFYSNTAVVHLDTLNVPITNQRQIYVNTVFSSSDAPGVDLRECWDNYQPNSPFAVANYTDNLSFDTYVMFKSGRGVESNYPPQWVEIGGIAWSIYVAWARGGVGADWSISGTPAFTASGIGAALMPSWSDGRLQDKVAVGIKPTDTRWAGAYCYCLLSADQPGCVRAGPRGAAGDAPQPDPDSDDEYSV